MVEPTETVPKFKTWKEIYCEHPESRSCTPKNVFRKVTSTNDDVPSLKPVTSILTQYDYTFTDDLHTVRDAEGNEKKTHNVLRSIKEKEGYTAHVQPCIKKDKKKNAYIPKQKDVLVNGESMTCTDVIATLSRSLEKKGYRSENGLLWKEDHKTRTLHQEAKSLDASQNEWLQTFQTYQNKIHHEGSMFTRLYENYTKAMEQRREESPLTQLIGTYPIKHEKDTFMHITNDPVEIALKSTGREWEKTSCERIAGSFWRGFTTDIEKNNLIAFIIDDQGTPLGRTMIRWGETRKGKICAGVEPSIYEKVLPSEVQTNTYKTIESLLKKKDLLDDTCKTPYVYKGYSDVMEKGNVKIKYGDNAFIDIPKDTHWLVYKEWQNYANTDVVDAKKISNSEIRRLLEYGYEWSDEQEAIDAYISDYEDNNLYTIEGMNDFAGTIIDVYEHCMYDDKYAWYKPLDEKSNEVYEHLVAWGKNMDHTFDEDDEIMLEKFLTRCGQDLDFDTLLISKNSTSRLIFDRFDNELWEDDVYPFKEMIVDILHDMGSWRLEHGQV